MANASNNNASTTESTENPRFTCYYCPNTFATRQALAGHQNAHRGEIPGTTGQQHAPRAHLVQSVPYPPSYPWFFLNQQAVVGISNEIRSCQHPFPPGLEQPCYNRPHSYNFTGLHNYPSQGLDAFVGLPSQPQPQPQPLVATSSPVCLDLFSGIKNTSQETNNATEEMVAGKEDDGPSLSLSISLGEKEHDGPSLSLSLGEKENDDGPSLSLSL